MPQAARAGRPTARAMLRCLGYSATIAIAALSLMGCDHTRSVTAFECREAHPGWRNPTTFTYIGRAQTPGGDCLFVTDTEGWGRKLCSAGPDQFSCRATTVTMPSKEATKP
jgi:hypothetical protein